MFKKGFVATLGCMILMGLSAAAPALASEYSPEEADALEHNLNVLCNESFEDLEAQGISFNEDGQEYLDVACDAVVDGIDESDFDDAEFSAAIDFLAEALAAVTYEE
jgi:hypothetical protein